MNVGGLLTELRHNILHDRSDKIAGVDDRLWSDATLVRYISEAETRFARLGLVIRDASSTEATYVTLQDGVDRYTLHPSVLAVISAKHAADVGDLTRLGHPAFGMQPNISAALRDPGAFASRGPGKPLAFSTDDEVTTDDNESRSVVSLRVYPVPDADWDGSILRLRVVRTPLQPLMCPTTSAYSVSQVPEVPSTHHIEMLNWAAYLALRINDHDAGNVSRAHEFREMFERDVTLARREAMRKMFAPSRWGFGQFTWEP